MSKSSAEKDDLVGDNTQPAGVASLRIEYSKGGQPQRRYLESKPRASDSWDVTQQRDSHLAAHSTNKMFTSVLHEIGTAIEGELRQDKRFICPRSNSQKSPVFHVGPIDECQERSELFMNSEIFSVLIHSWAIENWKKRDVLVSSLEQLAILVREKFSTYVTPFRDQGCHNDIGILFYSIIETRDIETRRNIPLAVNVILNIPLETAREPLRHLSVTLQEDNIVSAPDGSTTFLTNEAIALPSDDKITDEAEASASEPTDVPRSEGLASDFDLSRLRSEGIILATPHALAYLVAWIGSIGVVMLAGACVGLLLPRFSATVVLSDAVMIGLYIILVIGAIALVVATNLARITVATLKTKNLLTA